MTGVYPFDEAVTDFVSSLSEGRKSMLRNTFPIPRSEQDWPWFAEVIERYALRDKSSPVRRDINQRVEPDPEGYISEWWSSGAEGEPIFEALIFLDAARKTLNAQQVQGNV